MRCTTSMGMSSATAGVPNVCRGTVRCDCFMSRKSMAHCQEGIGRDCLGPAFGRAQNAGRGPACKPFDQFLRAPVLPWITQIRRLKSSSTHALRRLGSSCRKSESNREIRIVNNPLVDTFLLQQRFRKRRVVQTQDAVGADPQAATAMGRSPIFRLTPLQLLYQSESPIALFHPSCDSVPAKDHATDHRSRQPCAEAHHWGTHLV